MKRSLASTIEHANAALLVDGRLDAVGEYFTPDYVAHLTNRDLMGGHTAVRTFVRAVRRSFPDVRVDVDILLKSHDRVAWQRTLHAVHREDYMGFPATGRRIVWRDMITSRFRDGRIAEEWAISDLAEQLLRARKR